MWCGISLIQAPEQKHSSQSLREPTAVFIQYVFSNQGMVQGNISQTEPEWRYDDFWAPDYYANGVKNCSQPTCPFGLSDFFGNPTIGYFKNKRTFTQIPPQTYQPSDYTNLSSFGGLANNPPDDEETP